MAYDNDKRRRLLGRLSRQLAYTAPILALATGLCLCGLPVGPTPAYPDISIT